MEAIRHCWGTPLPQLTLLDFGVAAATLLVFSVLVELLERLFSPGED